MLIFQSFKICGPEPSISDKRGAIVNNIRLKYLCEGTSEEAIIFVLGQLESGQADGELNALKL